jgi:hypothetical protein
MMMKLLIAVLAALFCLALADIPSDYIGGMSFDLVPVTNAQTQISQCPDYCDSKLSVLYTKGVWDEKAKICKYVSEACKYGCESKSIKPLCAELPTTPPANSTDYSDTLWTMVKKVYDTKTGSMSIHGTEYNIGDSATVFLQLMDSQGQFINTGSCVLDIYYPNQPNLTHAQYIYDAPMIYKTGSDGLYFYDLTVPSVAGVYMLSATCSYAYMGNWFYPPYDVRKSGITVIQGVYEGDTYSLNSYEDAEFMRCASDSPVPQSCIATYSFNLSTLINVTNINIFYSGESNEKAKLHMFVWNWSSSSWVQLPNILTFSGRALSGTPTFIGDFISNSVPINNTINGSYDMLFMLKTNHTTSFKQYDNWLSLNILTAEGIIYNLKGSGELHVSNALSNLTVYINSTQLNDIAKSVWEYNSKNLTYYPAMDYQQVAQYVWNHTTRNLTDDLVSMVWNYPNRNLTYINFTDVLNAIQSSNASIISELHSVNQSIFNKLYLIQGDLSYINTTTIDTDYWVKQNYAILVNLTLGNVTVFADLNWTRLREEVWNKTSQEKIESDLLSLSDNEVQLVVTTQDCLNDTTLLFTHQVQRCILGYCINETLTETAPCTYGCANHQCRPDPMWMYGMLILIIIGVGAGLYVINRFVKF